MFAHYEDMKGTKMYFSRRLLEHPLVTDGRTDGQTDRLQKDRQTDTDDI